MVQPRNKMFGAGLLAVTIGVGAFLLLAPSVEREAHLAVVRSGEPENIGGSLRHLCWIRSGVQGLDELLPTLPLDRRVIVLREAESLGCLDQLAPRNRATYYIMDPEGAQNLEKAIGYQRDAIEPALEALNAGDEQTQKQAALVLASLSRLLNSSEQRRAIDLAERLANGVERRMLAERLGLAPAAEEPTPLPVEVSEELQQVAEPAVIEELVPRLEPPSFEPPAAGVLFRADAEKRPEDAEAPADDPVELDEPEEPEEPEQPEEPAERAAEGRTVAPTKPRPSPKTPGAKKPPPEEEPREKEAASEPAEPVEPAVPAPDAGTADG